MPTSTALISRTLPAGNGRNKYPDLKVEPGRAELRSNVWHFTSATGPYAPMNVLVLNSGSSNLKFRLIATDLGRISRSDSSLNGIVTPTDEQLLIARDTVQCILGEPGEHRAAATNNFGVREMTH